jgi:SAM-dependent methyltransferase
MANGTVYDQHVQFYIDFVDRGLADPSDVRHQLLARFKAIVGNRLRDALVCDVACGEGYLGRFLGRLGPREVIGVDSSAQLIEIARTRCDGENLTYRVDDAQRLATIGDASMDIVASQLAIMDIADHRAMFAAVRRTLKNDGMFVFSLLHPCFEGPFRAPEEPQFLIDASATPVAVVVRRYATEGYWQSGGTGVRGHMGAYHRMLSTLVNDLIAAGFVLQRMDEPVGDNGGLAGQVPRSLLIAARAAE